MARETGPLPVLKAPTVLILPGTDRERWKVLLVAIALSLVAVFLTYTSTAIATGSPFLLSLAAVAAAGWYGAWLGGLLATATTGLLLAQVVLQPEFGFSLSSTIENVRLLTFLGLSILVSWFNANLHRAGRRLRASEYLSRTIIESAPTLIAGADEHGDIVLFNKSCEAATGFKREDVIGRPFVETLVPTQWREEVNARFAPSSGTDLSTPHRNPWLQTSGEERLIEWRCFRVPAEHGNLILGIGADVTDRQRIEEELRAVADREAAARRDAEAGRLARERFIATMSHELRSPLYAILNWTAVIQNRSTETETQRIAERITHNAQLMTKVINDVFDLARIDAGKVAIAFARVDLNDVVRRTVDSLLPAAQLHQHSVSLELSDDIVDVDGDAARIQQMLLNLLSNALKFTPPRGAITVSTRLVDGHAEVSVRDSGPGLAGHDPEKLFEPFWQADGHRDGLGLGLPLVRQLARLHGGSTLIDAAAPDGGLVVAFRIPCRPGPENKAQVAS